MKIDVTATVPYNQSNQDQTRFLFLSVYILLIAVDTWFIISLIYYGFKTKKWHQLQPGNPDSLSSGRIYLSVVFCSIAVFCFHASVAVFRNVGFQQNENGLCNWTHALQNTTYGFCLISVIFFLWFRQRLVFTVFLPFSRTKKGIQCFSFIIIFVINFFGLVGLVLSIVPNDFVASPIGCIYRNDENLSLPSLMIVVSNIIFSQVSLLAILIYALLASHRSSVDQRLMCWKSKSSVKHSDTENQPTDRTRTIVNNVMKKTTVFAALSLLTDTFVVCLFILYQQQGERREFISILSSLSVLMNLCFVILSFNSWKDMITSLCRPTCVVHF